MQIEIPTSDLVSFSGLPAHVREEVKMWLTEINNLLPFRGKGVCQLFPEVAERLEVSEGTVLRKYSAVVKSRSWRSLVNRSKCSTGRAKTPSEFIPWWHGLVLENQRCTKKAYDRFIALYRAGEPIPGLPVSERKRSTPPGLSRRNLYRLKPPRAHIELARRGVAAARKFLPHVVQDVSHVRPLEYILFDDVELDFLIVVPESKYPVKLRLIVAMDLCSRMILGYGVRPAITRPDGVEDGLKLRDTKMVIARILRTWGIPNEYTMTLIVERGTAAVPDGDKAALAEISGGRIIVSETSMVVGQVFAFRDKATGNSWGKAWLESFFNPMHGELAHLPGQKGRRYDLAPAELEGRRKELAALVRAGNRIPAEMRYQLRWPFKTGAEALQELDAALHRLHNAPRDLQGFDRIALWRFSDNDTWKPEAELAAYPELIGRVQMDTRIETPAERFAKKIGATSFCEIADCSLQRLMDEHTPVRYMDYHFSFERQGTDYIYLPPDNMIPLLHDGKTYILWYHPQDMGTVYVTRDRPHLGYIGKLTRFKATRRGELAEAKAGLAEKSRIFNHALRETQNTRIDAIRQRADDLAHNAEILRNVHALEIETDVVTPSNSPALANAPAAVRKMTQDMADRQETNRRLKAARSAERRRISSTTGTAQDLIPQDEEFASGQLPAAPTPDTTEQGEDISLASFLP